MRSVVWSRSTSPGCAAARRGHEPARIIVPAHGPDEPRSGETKSLYPHYGWGMLKEAGVKDVKVRDGVVWYADHFAGLVAVSGAEDPGAHWQGSKGKGGYNNDDPSLGEGVLGGITGRTTSS